MTKICPDCGDRYCNAPWRDELLKRDAVAAVRACRARRHARRRRRIVLAAWLAVAGVLGATYAHDCATAAPTPTAS